MSLCAMAVRRSVVPVLRRGSAVARRRGGGGAVQPPFARTQTPTTRLHEEHELIWDDGVAAETCIDFDCAHLPAWWTLPTFFGGMGFYACFLGVMALSDPVGQNPVKPKVTRRERPAVDRRNPVPLPLRAPLPPTPPHPLPAPLLPHSWFGAAAARAALALFRGLSRADFTERTGISVQQLGRRTGSRRGRRRRRGRGRGVSLLAVGGIFGPLWVLCFLFRALNSR